METRTTATRVVGRYALCGQFASGGMASVHLGLVLGANAFTRPVAVKRMHPQFASDPEFVAMFLDEARLASRIRHSNVVATLDVVEADHEVLVVMEYVAGESLNALLRVARARQEPIPRAVASAILVGALDGLHAAHEARDEKGEPLLLVHRDVSPQNILVGVDGVARVLDFGIAKAEGRLQETRDGQIKGKLAYMAPEQLQRKATRASDLYAAGVCLWEVLTLQRLFEADNSSALLAKVLAGLVVSPRVHVPTISPELEAVTMKALARDPDARFATAREMARALERCQPIAPPSEVGAWVERLLGEKVRERADWIARIEGEEATDRHGAAAAAIERAHEAPRPSDDTATIPAEASATQLTQVSETDVSPPRSRRRVWASVTAAAALVAAISVITYIDVRPPPPPVAPAAIDSPALPAAPDSGQPLASAAAPPAPTPSASEVPLPVAASAPTIVRPRARPQNAPPHPNAACDPPYSVDADGVRHYKKQCFH